MSGRVAEFWNPTGQLTITDTCSDGATSITTAAADLRSKLLGISQ
jgi:hypothetical protein